MKAATALVGALVLVFVAAVSLVLPWLTIGSAPGRSSIDLIGSANALDVVGGPALALIVGTWLAVPVAAAAALVLGASGRSTAAAVVVLAISLLVASAAGAIVVSDAVTLAWGGAVGGLAATLAGAAAVGALVVSGRTQPTPAAHR